MYSCYGASLACIERKKSEERQLAHFGNLPELQQYPPAKLTVLLLMKVV